MLARPRCTWLLAAALTLSGSAPLTAQRAEPRFHRWEAPPIVPRSDTLPTVQGDYRYEGLLFGGLVFGALGAWLGTRDNGACLAGLDVSCGDSDKTGRAVVRGVLGAAAGGGLGYLVGRLSPKRPRPDTLASAPELAAIPDSVRVRVGYQHWRGAGIGLAIGTGLGALAGALASTVSSCDDCTESTSVGEAAVMAGLLGGGGGAVAGFLAGLASPKYITIPSTRSTD